MIIFTRTLEFLAHEISLTTGHTVRLTSFFHISCFARRNNTADLVWFLTEVSSWMYHMIWWPASGTELVGPSYRLIVGALPCFSWLLGCFLFELTAYLIRTRFYLELVPTIIMICTGVLLRYLNDTHSYFNLRIRFVDIRFGSVFDIII